MNQQSKYLIALDLDGTLLQSDMTIGSKTREILETLQREGHAISIATGRILKLAETVPIDLGFPAHVVACNGAIIKHAYKGIIGAHTFSPVQRSALESTLFSIERALQPTAPWGLYYHFYSEDTIYASALEHTAKKFQKVSQARLDGQGVNIQIIKDPRGPLNTKDVNVYKYGIYRDGTYDFTLARQMLDKIEGIETMFSAPNLLDIMLSGVSKWSGILELAGQLNIAPDHIMVFGDNENDLEMLANAGISVAMGNAAPAIQAQARHVALSNDEEGIYHFLSDFFKITP